jgi:hypothetical protein
VSEIGREGSSSVRGTVVRMAGEADRFGRTSLTRVDELSQTMEDKKDERSE